MEDLVIVVKDSAATETPLIKEESFVVMPETHVVSQPEAMFLSEIGNLAQGINSQTASNTDEQEIGDDNRTVSSCPVPRKRLKSSNLQRHEAEVIFRQEEHELRSEAVRVRVNHFKMICDQEEEHLEESKKLETRLLLVQINNARREDERQQELFDIKMRIAKEELIHKARMYEILEKNASK